MQNGTKLLNGSGPNDIKANFDSIYSRPDPREYYRVLYGLDYVIPDLAKGIFRKAMRGVVSDDGLLPMKPMNSTDIVVLRLLKPSLNAERKAPGGQLDGVVLRRMHPPAQHITKVPLQWIRA